MPRTFQLTLCLGVLVVYTVLAIEIGQAQYALVNDYIALTNIHGGWWPADILRRLINPFGAGAWLYRPFADTMSWLLAVVLERHAGTWHVALIVFRLISGFATYLAAEKLTGSREGACVGAAYFTFFPAIPEIDLIRVETYLMLSLTIAFYGYCRLVRGSTNTGVVAMTATAFIAATMSKEVVAPSLVILFCFLVHPIWRRGTFGRTAIVVMALATLNQAARFALLAAEPYASQRQSGFIESIVRQAMWTAKILLLATTNFPLVPFVVIAGVALGTIALVRGRSPLDISVVTLLLISVGMSVIAPYPAIRYLSPAAFFIALVLAAGVEEARRRFRPRVVNAVAYATLVLFIVYGGAVICAQASSMRNSTRADWSLLQYAARALAEGRDVVMLEDYDFERALWVRAELAGVDARYPFITYVADQSSRGLPIAWPSPATAPVNLTGAVPEDPRGRFSTARRPDALPPGSLVIPANPAVDRIAANVTLERVFDFTHGTFLTRALQSFARFARLTNPKFRYVYDLGESPFPGTYWVTFTAK